MTIDQKHLWFVAPEIGALSEVWMYRQAAGMPKLRTEVVTLEHANAESYPAKNFSVSVVPKFSTWARVKRRLTNGTINPYLPYKGQMKWYEALYAEKKPDVMLCQYGPTANNMNEVARHLKIPLVVHFHGYDLSFYLKSSPSYVKELKSNCLLYTSPSPRD